MKKIVIMLLSILCLALIVGCTGVSDEKVEKELDGLSDDELEEIVDAETPDQALAGQGDKPGEVPVVIQYLKKNPNQVKALAGKKLKDNLMALKGAGATDPAKDALGKLFDQTDELGIKRDMVIAVLNGNGDAYDVDCSEGGEARFTKRDGGVVDPEDNPQGGDGGIPQGPNPGDDGGAGGDPVADPGDNAPSCPPQCHTDGPTGACVC